MNKPAPRRIPAAERRELMLDAASVVFGERGYAGATTDAIADAAGVSQAYVVRTFGSKENLFAEAATRAIDRIAAVFREAGTRSPAPGADMQSVLGRAYVDLVADRGILLTTMHLFTLGHHPRFGPLARTGMLDIYRVLRDEVGLTDTQCEEFLAKGMLINTVLGLGLPGIVDDEPEARNLMTCIFEDDTHEVLSLTADQEPFTAIRRETRRGQP
ncbi:TetR/AcrR family transcriptional regulator [Corynebacterium glyciniphilum]|uniref:TetR/AcrR family transcriptional regulator n=1 Tax=Corynebacterium glyciniphilum TaxID=1404244 RepID=UPI0021B1EE32|nr:TetR/AcrR family transcriptional regulator [Corynebacterium glyciniphilum]